MDHPAEAIGAVASARLQSREEGDIVMGWFSKIETAEQAEKAIKEVSWLLYLLAGVDLLLVLFLHRPLILLDVLLLLAFGVQFSRTRSGCVALLIAGYALVNGALTVLSHLGFVDGIGTNIFLVMFIVAAAFRGVQAAVIYHGEHETRTNVKGVVILSIIATALSAVGFVAVIVGAIAAGYDLESDAGSTAAGVWLMPAVAVPWFLVFGRMPPFVRRLRVVKSTQT